jgi:hypothetical protein
VSANSTIPACTDILAAISCRFQLGRRCSAKNLYSIFYIFPLPLPSLLLSRYTSQLMANIPQPNIKLVNNPDYRETYANSVQVRVNVWDFFLVFGTMQQQSESQVEVHNFQGIYLSPQQAKALMAILQQNVTNYESTFGEIKLDPRMNPTGPVH